MLAAGEDPSSVVIAQLLEPQGVLGDQHVVHEGVDLAVDHAEGEVGQVLEQFGVAGWEASR